MAVRRHRRASHSRRLLRPGLAPARARDVLAAEQGTPRAQASSGQQKGAQGLAGGKRKLLGGDLDGGFCAKPAVVRHHNKMHIVREEVSGPVLPSLALKGEAGVQAIANANANAPRHGRRAGIPSRDMKTAFCTGCGILAGRVRTNCHSTCPAHAAFGGS